jgi:anti-sigma factor RsiW
VSCETLTDRLTGYLDRELDQRDAAEVEAHLRHCVACSARLERERRLRGAIQAHLQPLAAPERVRSNVHAAVRAQVERAQRRQAWLPAWAATAAALVLGLAGGWQLARWQSSRGDLSDLTTEVVAGHVRSLQGAHLTDIGSGEHHTVKPWFAGKLDFSPPVPDLSAQGFVLAGARLDYLGERQVAALVYRRRQHVINLFVWPTRDSTAAPSMASFRGYQVVHGAAGGIAYWAVSDLNQTELSEFARLTAAELGHQPAQP